MLLKIYNKNPDLSKDYKKIFFYKECAWLRL